MNKEKIDKFFEEVDKANNKLEKFNNEFQTLKENVKDIADLTSKAINFVKSLFGDPEKDLKKKKIAFAIKEKLANGDYNVVEVGLFDDIISDDIKKSLHISPDVEKKLTNEDRENIERFTEDLFNTIKDRFNTYDSLNSLKNKVKSVYISFCLGYKIENAKHVSIDGNKGYYFVILSNYSDINSDAITSLRNLFLNVIPIKDKISDFLSKYEDNFTIVIGLDKELKLPE